MKPETVEERLSSDVSVGLMTQDQMDELLTQRDFFESKREEIEAVYQNKMVGIADGQLFVGNSPHDVFDQVKAQLPGKLVYLEPIGFDLFN